jgi:hypothetical protein
MAKKTISEINKLYGDWQLLSQQLSDAIYSRFPKGTPVSVNRGGKFFEGVVFAAPHGWHEPYRLGVESRTGWKFWANYADVQEIL